MGSFCQQPAFLSDIRKGTVAVVVIENVLAPIGDKEIVVAVVVIVSDTDALSPAEVCQASLTRDVWEGAIAVVVQQTVGMLLRIGRVQPRAIHEKNVRPAIVIVINERCSATGCLENIGVVSESTVGSRFR